MVDTKCILVVDDEPAQRQLLTGFVESLGYRATEAATGEEALQRVAAAKPDLVLLDVRLPGISGMEVLERLRSESRHIPVLMITAHADLRQAVSAVKSGADDYLAKPLDLDELEAAIQDLVGSSSKNHSTTSEPLPLPEDVVAESAAMKQVIRTVAVVAPSQVPVLILGPSGAGKEVVAELIHRWSNRSDQPMVATNCAGLPESLIESELFGHVKGAFTGADAERQGVFRAADGGTLFLDEIGELPLHLQPKLLRALESGQITPVGSDHPVTVNCRLVAATNRNLREAVEAGGFREDLYYRINVVELNIPPLTERGRDVLQLAKQFAQHFAGGPVRFSPATVQCLLAYSWPGNVRELRNAIQLACLMCRGDLVLPEHLPPKIAAAGQNAAEPAVTSGRLSEIERAAILAALEECGGNRTQAAKKLGISRRGLIYKLRAMEQEDA